MRIIIEWRNITSLMTSATNSSFAPTFHTSPYNKPYRLLGIAPQFRLRARNLIPTSSFYQSLNAALNRAPGTKEPIADTYSGDRSYGIEFSIPNIKLYESNILAAYNLARIVPTDESSFKDLIRMRAMNKMQLLQKANQTALDEVNTCLTTTDRGYNYRAKPLYLLELPLDIDVANYVRTKRTELVGLLIGNIDYESMNEDIVTEITERCEILNKKSVYHYLLASKQGIVLVRRPSSASGDWQSNGLFHRSSACFELASVCHQILSLYPQMREADPEVTDISLAITSYLVRNSRAIFNESYSTRALWELLTEEMALGELLDLVLASDSNAAKVLD